MSETHGVLKVLRQTENSYIFFIIGSNVAKLSFTMLNKQFVDTKITKN